MFVSVGRRANLSKQVSRQHCNTELVFDRKGDITTPGVARKTTHALRKFSAYFERSASRWLCTMPNLRLILDALPIGQTTKEGIRFLDRMYDAATRVPDIDCEDANRLGYPFRLKTDMWLDYRKIKLMRAPIRLNGSMHSDPVGVSAAMLPKKCAAHLYPNLPVSAAPHSPFHPSSGDTQKNRVTRWAMRTTKEIQCTLGASED